VAIGSGGFVGKGFLEGSMTRLKFVPEQETDFIFSTIGEEQGFIGALAVIILYLGLIMRTVFVGENRENAFIRIYGYGLAGVLFFHFFVNIGMTMGLVPVVGIPLPLISKGGSAMVLFSLMISVFLRLSKSRL
jgi:rod shape determining protein RodA